MKITITLQSSDGEQFTTDIAVAKKSKTLRTMLEDIGVEEDVAEENEIKEISTFFFVVLWVKKKLNFFNVKIFRGRNQ